MRFFPTLVPNQKEIPLSNEPTKSPLQRVVDLLRKFCLQREVNQPVVLLVCQYYFVHCVEVEKDR